MLSFIVPTPNVLVTALNNQQVGDPLLLECNVTTVRGITSSVDIVWSTNDEAVISDNNTLKETVDNLVLHSNTYRSRLSLSKEDDNTKYQCSVEIDTDPLISKASTLIGETIYL